MRSAFRNSAAAVRNQSIPRHPRASIGNPVQPMCVCVCFLRRAEICAVIKFHRFVEFAVPVRAMSNAKCRSIRRRGPIKLRAGTRWAIIYRRATCCSMVAGSSAAYSNRTGRIVAKVRSNFALFGVCEEAMSCPPPP